LKIHGPSIGIGAAIAGITVFAIFMIAGSGFGNSADTATLDKARYNQNNDNVKFQTSLLSDHTSPILGSKDAPITMVEFGDYQCFYCNQFYHTTEPDIVKNYVNTGKVKLVFKDLTIIGQDSINAAHAAHCAQEKGKFWEYHDMFIITGMGKIQDGHLQKTYLHLLPNSTSQHLTLMPA
jgi:protein-disulfide isomerase